MIALENILLDVKQGDNLLEALQRVGMDMIPSNVILNKVLPGLGATHAEIIAPRNSIIIEPNVPVIKGKVKKYDDLKSLGIYEGVTQIHVQKYLCDDSIPLKKIITTPEGFSKIRGAAKKVGIDIYTDYFCMFDECEKLIQDNKYRPKITNPVEDFFKFDRKAFVSATPLDIQHPEIINFHKLLVNPVFEYKKRYRTYCYKRLCHCVK